MIYKGDDADKDVVGLADYAARNVNNEIRRVPGVGKVQVFGAEAAMRIWIDPQKLIGYGLSVADVARLEVGSEDYNFEMLDNGKKSVGAAVQLRPGANALQTASAVKARLAELSKTFPADIAYSVSYDTSRFVDIAIEKVIHTLVEAVVLVFLVIFLFL